MNTNALIDQDDLDAVREHLDSGLALDFALSRDKVSERAIVAVLRFGLDAAARPAPAMPSVLALAWQEAEDQLFEAKTPLGTYELNIHPDAGCIVLLHMGRSSTRRVFERRNGTPQEARAAAQADFEHVVRACLVPAATEPTVSVASGTHAPSSTRRRMKP